MRHVGWSAWQAFGEVNRDGVAFGLADELLEVGGDGEFVGSVAECHE